LLIITALLGSLVTPRRGAGNAGADCEYCVCAVQFGYHSALILPIETTAFSWRDSLETVAPDGVSLSSIRYLGFGWGERQWYVNPPTDDKIFHKLLESARALLLPNRAVLKVERYAEFPTQQQTKCIGVTPARYLQLVSFIQQSFQRDAQNQIRYIAEDQVYPASFYEATGTYSLLNNCNHWTAHSLRLAGADTPLWPAHAAAIIWLLQPTCPNPQSQRLLDSQLDSQTESQITANDKLA
jgi:uncharacterized protein (TIGR02117 family)